MSAGVSSIGEGSISWRSGGDSKLSTLLLAILVKHAGVYEYRRERLAQVVLGRGEARRKDREGARRQSS